MNAAVKRIRDIALLPSVQAESGIVSDWPSHVFISYDLAQFSGSIGVGRLPMVIISEVSANYEPDAQPSNAGLRTSTIVIRCMAHVFRNRTEAAYDRVMKMRNAIQHLLGADTLLAHAGMTTQPIATVPYAVAADITIQTVTNYDDECLGEDLP